jgi:hypothetical protein
LYPAWDTKPTRNKRTERLSPDGNWPVSESPKSVPVLQHGALFRTAESKWQADSTQFDGELLNFIANSRCFLFVSGRCGYAATLAFMFGVKEYPVCFASKLMNASWVKNGQVGSIPIRLCQFAFP